VAEVTAVLVDDEPPARAKLRRFLEEDGRVTVVGEAGDGAAAVRLVEEAEPDLVFLDVQMPGMDGFEVLEALEVDPLPRVVFVTAYEEHALRAFEVRALDYLLKPVDRERFTRALDRALEAAAPGATDARGVLSALAERRPLERFLVRTRGRMVLVPVEDVDWIGAAGNYVAVHAGGQIHLVRGTLQELEERLPAERFVRIHRSSIVNLDRVREMHPWSHGDLMVVLEGGEELRLSRRYRDRLEGVFGP
jgi:two-component system, LytTR family, response regulator